MSWITPVAAFVVAVFLTAALASEWAARRLVSRLDEGPFESPRDGRGDDRATG